MEGKRRSYIADDHCYNCLMVYLVGSGLSTFRTAPGKLNLYLVFGSARAWDDMLDIGPDKLDAVGYFRLACLYLRSLRQRSDSVCSAVSCGVTDSCMTPFQAPGRIFLGAVHIYLSQSASLNPASFITRCRQFLRPYPLLNARSIFSHGIVGRGPTRND